MEPRVNDRSDGPGGKPTSSMVTASSAWDVSRAGCGGRTFWRCSAFRRLSVAVHDRTSADAY